ncbi:hypothetical protein HMPREF0239_00489 [Clostridium sp. ATCC BAA-442]|nr:hypothetical protein HMPREF0239_00489 [Clostridium sp. ATCC BAA-442]
MNQIFFILPNYAGRYEVAEAGSGEGGGRCRGNCVPEHFMV